ncbi:hypothetical protein MGG_17400 [Pyricularia oryzae 70-15]|uniref:Uncharacterized protein n=1 Tax=Pyricularia oryzae (strain 70-15 / ATCC MYA-4617 / FGSC 8958) TaxID=242507 RepID=G4NB27_PYRO7|nr:uncharacterized protein MGG_17400 [Pyricularia oryzae 70-15]EHA48789.1 hypothetical protein MGG_17400 [Pyricularia oryzae 70-15]
MPGDAGAVSKTLDKFLSKGLRAVELFPRISLATAARLPAPLSAPVCQWAQGLFVGLLARRLQLLAKSGAPRTGSELQHADPSHICARGRGVRPARVPRSHPPTLLRGHAPLLDHVLGLPVFHRVGRRARGPDVADLAASYLLLAAGRIAWVARRGDRRLHRRETGRYLSVVGGGKPWIVDRELGRLMGEDDRFLQLEVGTWILERRDGPEANAGAFRPYHPVSRCYLATSFRTHVDRGRSGISNDTVAQVIGRVSEAVCTRGVISDASVLGVVKGHDPVRHISWDRSGWRGLGLLGLPDEPGQGFVVAGLDARAEG